MARMTFSTLAVVNSPTLHGGLTELLLIGDALSLAGYDCGVSITRSPDGRLVAAEPDYELPTGVLETSTQLPVDPWTTEPASWADYTDAAARRELLELLARVNPSRDLLATAERVEWL